MNKLAAGSALVIVFSAAAGGSAPPCEPDWSAGFRGGEITGGWVEASAVFDEDGAGGDPPTLFIGGYCLNTVGDPAVAVARRDEFGWSPVGGGLSGATCFSVHDLFAVDYDDAGLGQAALYAAGDFTGAGSVAASNIARWDGEAWSTLGSGTNSSVWALMTTDSDGPGPLPATLYAGGTFTQAGGAPTQYVARWDGASWSPVGTGTNAGVQAFVTFDEDGPGPGSPALFVGGYFSSAGGMPAGRIARWNGAAWSNVGAGVGGTAGGGWVDALVVFDDDGAGPNPAALWVAGRFAGAGTVAAQGVARWDGTAWSSPGGGIAGTGTAEMHALGVFDQDGPGPLQPSLYAGGWYIASSGIGQGGVFARLEGSVWGGPPGLISQVVNSMTVFDPDGTGPELGALHVGGAFDTLGSTVARCIATWNGVAFAPLAGRGMSGGVRAVTPYDVDGPGPEPSTLFAGGYFSHAGGARADGIARLQIGEWEPMPGGGCIGGIESMAVVDHDGTGPVPASLYAGGNFGSIGGTPASRVARWDGAGWSALGDGLSATGFYAIVYELESVERDVPGFTGPALYVGGRFTAAGSTSAGCIARWDGRAWSPLGAGIGGGTPYVAAIAGFDDDGPGPHEPYLYVGGGFSDAGGVPADGLARWNGVSWGLVGAGTSGYLSSRVDEMIVYDDDGPGPRLDALYVGGGFWTAGGITVRHVARWDGAAWSALGTGLGDSFYTTVRAMAVHDEDGAGPLNPTLFVAGEFTVAGGIAARNIARWNGTVWSALGAGLELPAEDAVVFDEDGPGPGLPALYLGGHFRTAGTVGSQRVARWGCPTPGACYPNCNGDGTPAGLPSLTVADFGCFQTRFVMGEPYADCDGDGQLTPADFVCFQAAFVSGCR